MRNRRRNDILPTYATRSDIWHGDDAMTLLWAEGTAEALASLRNMDLDGDAYLRLVRRLTYLENDASGFDAVYGLVTVGQPTTNHGPLLAHVVEADPGHVFVVLYRLVTNSEDVVIVGLRYDR